MRPAAAERITSLGAPTPDSTTLHLVDEVVTAEEELETVFPIHIEPAGRADAESRLVFVRNVPNGARLSKGQSDSSGNWKLASDQLRDLKLFMPPGSASSTRMKIALLTPKGVELSNAHMTVVIRPHEPAPPSDDEKHPSKLSQANDPVDVEARVDIYLQRGNEFLANGNVASAREFYRRAANAESAQGALALGATYDPNYFDRLGIQGMLADPEMARKWYDRAAELGSKDAIDRISILEGRQFESPQAK